MQGKTAPRLIQDLLSYDPRFLLERSFNPLTNVHFHDEGGKDANPPLPSRNCQHEWSIKRNQSVLPDDNLYSPNILVQWKVACCCPRCRSHLDVLIEIGSKKVPFIPCPSPDFPLHHFVHEPEHSEPRNRRMPAAPVDGFEWIDFQRFRCSSEFCLAKLTIRFKPARLIPAWVDQLTDSRIIRARAEKAIYAEPQKFEGMAPPVSANILDALLTYIKNAMYEPIRSKTIQGNNKRWLISFGEPCATMLEYLGFQREVKASHAPSIINA